jgi:hypothetical protein
MTPQSDGISICLRKISSESSRGYLIRSRKLGIDEMSTHPTQELKVTQSYGLVLEA